MLAGDLLGRHFFVVERLPGRPLMGGVRVYELIASGWGVFRQLVEITASSQPALDVGYTAMSLHVAPIDAPAPIQRMAGRGARWMSDRYVAAYLRETGADLTNQPYYEALRCASELTNVVSYRLARARGQLHDAPRPTWDSVAAQMVEYFRVRTGETLELPPPVGRRA